MDIASSIFFVGLLIFLAHLFSGLFSKTKIPDVLLLMLIGLLIGPMLGIVSITAFGEIGTLLATITLVVILFQGGLDLRLDVLARSLRGSVLLTVANFVVTTAIVGALAMIMLGLDYTAAFMLGAILGGTSSAVVIPLVHQLRLAEESKTMLLLESALSDVLCIVVAIAFLESLKLGEINAGAIAGKIVASFLVASIIGIIGAVGWSMLLQWVRRVENGIFLTPAFVFVIYGVAEMLGYSGAIAALAFGIALGNADFFNRLFSRLPLSIHPVSLISIEKVFFSEISFLLKTFFFVFIGISIVLTNQTWMIAGLILTLVIFYVRVPIVWSSVQRSVPVADVSIMAVMVPKGLAAAVLASMPLQQGVAGGEMIQCITYAVVLFSITINSALVFLLEKTPVSRFYGWMFQSFGRQSVLKTDGADVLAITAEAITKS